MAKDKDDDDDAGGAPLQQQQGVKRRRRSLKSEPSASQKNPKNAGSDDANDGEYDAEARRERRRREIQQADWGLTEVLAECGLTSLEAAEEVRGNSIIEEGCPLEPGVSPSSLRASVHALLSEMHRNGIDVDNARVVESMEGLVSGCDRTALRRMLLPLKERLRQRDETEGEGKGDEEEEEEEAYHHAGSADASSSLIKVLLRVDALQSPLLIALLQRLPEFAAESEDGEDDEEEAAGGNGSVAREDLEEIPRLLLSQIRWLDHVVDPTTLTSSALDCLSVLCSTGSTTGLGRSVTLDLISTLPDVCADDSHPDSIDRIASTLRDVRTEDPTLLVPCLDALGTLRLDAAQIESVTADALDALQAVEDAWALPSLVKFLVQSAPSAMCDDVVDGLRALRLGGGDDEMDVDNDGGGRESSPVGTRSDAEALALETLARGLQYRSDLASTLLRKIKSTPPNHHGSSDVWLLFCCSVAPHHKPSVRAAFRSKAVSGGFTSNLICDAICGNGRSLRFLVRNESAVSDLADGLLRCPEKAARELGGRLYEALFEEFDDAVQRQEVVGNLVTHAGSGSNDEVDAALKVLSRIASSSPHPAASSGDGRNANGDGEKGPASLRPYAPFLTSLLDHIQRFTPSQARRLFMLLFAVGGEEAENGESSGGLGGGCDDVQIVIRKHLSLAPVAMKRIGIIGAVSFAVSRSLVAFPGQGESVDPEETCLEDESGAAAAVPPAVAEVTDVLELAYANCAPRGGGTATYLPVADSAHGMAGSLPGGGNALSQGLALAYLFDELCYAVRGGQLAPAIRDWITERFAADLEESFLGDINEAESSQNGGKSEKFGTTADECVAHIDDEADRAIMDGTSTNPLAPKGALRFNIDGDDAAVYVKFLSLLSSNDSLSRNALPLQLCPLFILIATCHDVRYGGAGTSEIDAVLGCPLFLPSESSVGIEFQHLPAAKQWTVTACTFFATSWVRELINCFIYSATFPSEDTGTAADDSQATSHEEIRSKIVERLRALVQLEEDLQFCSSKCLDFAPPGLDPLPAPKEMIEMASDDEEMSETGKENEAHLVGDSSSNKMTKEEKKALASMKKAAAKKAAARAKSKQKLLKIRARHESLLAERSIAALRPLSPLTCLALGFPEMSVMGQGGGGGGSQQMIMSLGASQLENLSVGGPLTTLLLSKLHDCLSSLFSNKNSSGFPTRLQKTGPSSTVVEETSIVSDLGFVDNPYKFETSASPSHNGGRSPSNSTLKSLDIFLNGGVFGSLHEHLAAVAEIRGGRGRGTGDDEEERNLLDCIRLLFGCVTVLIGAEELIISPQGRGYLGAIMTQLSTGEVDCTNANRSETNPSAQGLMKSLCDLFDLCEEIVMGGETDDLPFVMEGVGCLEAILQCALRLHSVAPNLTHADKKTQNVSVLRKKLSHLCHRLLQRKWSSDTKYNKTNVGKIVSLYIDHSFAPLSPDIQTVAETDVSELGRIGALTVVIRDVLSELPNTENCKGPVETFPTCCYASFGSYFSTALSFLSNELEYLFESPLGKPKEKRTVEKTLEALARLVELLGVAFDLTKENAIFVKRPFLLQQLRWGTRFVEIFVSQAMPFLQANFQEHDTFVINIIKQLQTSTRQLGSVIAHGKRQKDSNLAKETPRAKKILETFIFKVKMMMKKNQCVTAFWGGKLKTKHIDGSLVDDAKDSSDDDEAEEEEGGDEDTDTENEENEYEFED